MLSPFIGRRRNGRNRYSASIFYTLLLPLVLTISACGMAPLKPPTEVKASNVNADAALTPITRITRDLTKLPPPDVKVPVAVYAFRDQTGQFKGQPDSNLSNSVTQGAASILVKALLDSGWFMPIEREGFQNLLNERRVARTVETVADKGKPGASYPQLLAASYILEGGIVGYESNVRTGGQGANLLGIGGETKYRIDQVTINLRSVDVRTGQVINSVSTTKTIFSHEISASIYRFVDYKALLQAEGGYSTNEPSQLAVKEAIETAVIHLTLQGVRDGAWALRNPSDWETPMVQNYVREVAMQLTEPELSAAMKGTLVPMRESSLVKAAQLPLHLLQPEPAMANTPVPARPTAQPAAAADKPLDAAGARRPAAAVQPMPPMPPRPPGPVASGLAPLAEPSPPAPPPRPQAVVPEVAPSQSRLLETQDDVVVLSQLSR
jgi:curli production assembly/transport component CsgG